MRNVFAAIFFALSLTAVGAYLTVTLSPFDQQAIDAYVINNGIETRGELTDALMDEVRRGSVINYINLNNALALSIIWLAAVGVWLTIIQVALIWVRVRRGFSRRHLVQSLRRAFFIDIALLAIVYYRLFAVDIYLYAVTILLLLVLEVLITRAYSQRRNVKVEQNSMDKEKGDADQKHTDPQSDEGAEEDKATAPS